MNLFEHMKVIEDIIDTLTPTVSLNTFFDAISDGIDEHISGQKNTGKTFIGGRTIFSLSEDREKILIEAELYYIAKDHRYIKQEFPGMFWFSRIHESERQKFVNMLGSDGKLCVDVLDPD